jgi:hypothetical protein
LNVRPSPISPAIASLLAWLACLGCSSAAPTAADGTTVSPSPALRQGQEGIVLVMTRAAGGLSGASAIALGDLVVQRRADSTDARLVLAVSVPHGAALGPRALTFTDARGPVTVADVVAVGAITSAPAGRDTDLGTTAVPFRSVGQALRVAGAGDTVELLDGTYDAAGGETWDYAPPENLTIEGQSAAATALRGPGGAQTGLEAAPGLVVRNLSLDAFDVGVSLTRSGALTLENVSLRGQTAAVRVDAAGSTLTLRGGALGAVRDGLVLGDHCVTCVVDADGTTLGADASDGHALAIAAAAAGSKTSLRAAVVNGAVLVDDAAATLTIVSSTIHQTATTSAVNFAGGTLDMTDSTITNTASVIGINFQSGTLTLSGDTITGGSYCVYQLSGSSKVRGTKLHDYGFIGYYLAKGDLDLGTQTEAGNNEFASQATGPAVFGLYVDDITSPVTCSGTTFNGVLPPPGTRTAGADPIAEPGEYFINTDKTMSFWTP